MNSNKIVARNSLFLSFRMLFVLLITLYTSRIILESLGFVDYGLYYVVAGAVSMFSFINGSMITSTQRFLSFSLGEGDHKEYSKVFSMSINIHVLIGILILIIAETFGLWFILNKLNVPDERISAIFWVYQFSILSLVVSLINVSYNALIISQEKMQIFAYVGIFEVLFKMIIAYSLLWTGHDKLIVFSVLIFVSTLAVLVINYFVTKLKLKFSNYKFSKDVRLFKKLVTYSAWNLWGSLAFVLSNQGVNILLNLYFGPVVNAARGIAFQVKNAVNNFSVNLQTAINPQLIKRYAANEMESMHTLLFQSQKFSFFLLFVMVLPLIFNTKLVLNLWLNELPSNSIIFTQLILINILIDTFSTPLMTSAHATGKIKKYQIIVGILLLLNLPITYFFFESDYSANFAFYTSILISFMLLFVRFAIISPLIQLRLSNFLKSVIFKIIPFVIISLPLAFLVNRFMEESLSRLIVSTMLTLLMSTVIFYATGLDLNEKNFLKHYLQKIFKKK